MAICVVHHRVRDFDAWKQIFDEHEEARRSHGAVRHWVSGTRRTPDVVVAVEFPVTDAARARSLAYASLQEAMSRGGVGGEPQVHVREEIEMMGYAPPPGTA